MQTNARPPAAEADRGAGTQSTGGTTKATIPRRTDRSRDGRLPCRTPGCRRTRPVVPLSVRWHDKCHRCAAGISARSARAQWINAESDSGRLLREVAELRDRIAAFEEAEEVAC